MRLTTAGEPVERHARATAAHSRRHSALWSVYGPEGPAAFLTKPTEDEIYIRTSPSARTYQVRPACCGCCAALLNSVCQVSGGLLTGMGRSQSHGSFAVHAQPSPIVSQYGRRLLQC